MRSVRPLPLLAFASILCATLGACNFLVEAKLKGNVSSVPEGGLPDAACSSKNPNTSCFQCVMESCGPLWDSVRGATDASVTRGLAGEMEQCGCDPTIGNYKTWPCSDVVLYDAGYVGIQDPSGWANDFRTCFTEKCRASCRVCQGLTYKRFANDTTPPPLVPDVNPCAACLLDACQSVLVDGPPAGKSNSDHCCYESTVQAVWGDCVIGMGCGAIVAAYGDGAPANSCDSALAACAMKSCRSACGF